LISVSAGATLVVDPKTAKAASIGCNIAAGPTRRQEDEHGNVPKADIAYSNPT